MQTASTRRPCPWRPSTARSRCARLRGLIEVLLLCSSSVAFAADPLNSSDKPTNAAPADAGKNGTHDEFNVLPVAGGSTDIGFGGGFFAGFAHFKEGSDPYVWNVESAGLLTFKPREGGGVVLPYQDIYAKLTVPRFLTHSMRFEIRPSYTAETTIAYYGLGNNSSSVAPPGAPSNYFQYQRVHPQLDLDLRWRIVDHLVGRIGGRYIQNWIDTSSDSKLANDLQSGSPEVRGLLGSTAPHAVALFKYGLQWDDRDNEVSAHAGTFRTLEVKVSPGGAGMFPYRYEETTATFRGFLPIWKQHVTLAGRLVGDVLAGNPPFYELSRFDDTFAIGGGTGVRGVPAGRYSGKIKVLGNVEVRTELVSFHALGKPLLFGMVAFFDAGRLWADLGSHPELDGRGIGLKYGTGGGLRLQSGSTFILRIDLAYSPDGPLGGYFAGGQMF